MSQGEIYAKMCMRRWTSWGDALRGGVCGNSPWKRWEEWAELHRIYGRDGLHYKNNGKFYREETRKRKVKVNGRSVWLSERRLVLI